MAAKSIGTICSADPEHHLIQQYDDSSEGFVTISANVGAPSSLAADDDGNLYFNDPDGCRVRRLSQGIVATIAGTGTCGYTNDGAGNVGTDPFCPRYRAGCLGPSLHR